MLPRVPPEREWIGSEMSGNHETDGPRLATDTQPPGRQGADLLAHAISQPSAAMTTALGVLSGGPKYRERSLAHHALAIVERDRGRIPQALGQIRLAVKAARMAGPDREAEVRATYGTILLFAGATSKALKQLDRALALTTGPAVRRVLHLRGSAFWLLGRYDEAARDLARSIRLSRAAGDRLWEGRSLGALGNVRRALGDLDGALNDFAVAESVHLEAGEVVEAMLYMGSRAMVLLQQGDVVGALALMQDVDDRLHSAGVDPVEQLVDHASALLAARLASEAETLLDDVLSRADLAPVWRADLLLASARAALIREEWKLAESRAQAAQKAFRSQRRPRWAARSNLLALEAAQAAAIAAAEGISEGADPAEPGLALSASRQRGLLEPTRRLVATLREQADPMLPEALLLLAEVADAAGRRELSGTSLEEAAARRDVGAPLPRAAGWLAAARLAAQRGDRRALRHACRRGLESVDEHRSLIGDLELRALAGGYGLDLVSLAVDDAVDAGDARGVLWWTERWRATALGGTTPGPPDDPDLARDIAALRDVTRRLGDGDGAGPLERERSRLESAVRTRYRRLRAGTSEAAGPDLRRLVDRLGETVMLTLVLVHGRLHAVTVADGRISLRDLGAAATALREADFARFTLRRAANGRTVDLRHAGTRLQDALLGDPHPAWSRPSVLISPAASLLTVPFGLLPVFRDSAVTVSPSAGLWLRAAETADSEGSRQTGPVALVTGPGLSTHQREVAALRELHRDAIVLGGDDATVDQTLEALDGAQLGHIAAHGTFRADAPLFSSLRLADGPLMVHDLDRLARPPRAVVLSACDSGGVHPITAHEALGLVSSLLALGTRSVVASVNPVNDSATATVMKPVHATVAAGGSLAEGLLAARRSAGADSLLGATAAAFNAWGA